MDVLLGRRLRRAELPPAHLDPSAEVVDSVIGADSRIGADARIQRSVLFRDCQVNAKASVVDSVLADSVYVGEGARLERCVIGYGQRVERGEHLIGVKRPDG